MTADPNEESTGCQLYVVSPPQIVLESFIVQLEEALDTGGVACFQLRLKDVSDAQILEVADKLVAVCRRANVPFILNDRPDLALTCGADGVHLGQDDMSIKEARSIVGPDLVIGVSCHASKHLAMEAAEAGADYVAFGAFYPTKTKSPEMIKKWGTPTVELVHDWCAYTEIPCIAIGGITPQNCVPLAEAGADFVAAITSVWEHPGGAGEAVRQFSMVLTPSDAL